MRLHLQHLSPEIHGILKKHQAEHSHKNLEETVSCLIMLADTVFKISDSETSTLPCDNKGWGYPVGNCAPPIGNNKAGNDCRKCPLRSVISEAQK